MSRNDAKLIPNLTKTTTCKLFMFFPEITNSEVIFHTLSKEEELSFTIDESHQVKLKGLPDVEGPPGSFRRGLFEVTMVWEIQPPRKVLPMFQALASRRLPEGT